MDKGLVVDRLVDTLGAKAILFAGDDLGDVEAFEALTAWQNEGLSTLKVCSASSEERNSAASSARRSPAHGRLDRAARTATGGGSARTRDRMNACRDANDSLTGGSSAPSVAASAACSM